MNAAPSPPDNAFESEHKLLFNVFERDSACRVGDNRRDALSVLLLIDDPVVEARARLLVLKSRH